MRGGKTPHLLTLFGLSFFIFNSLLIFIHFKKKKTSDGNIDYWWNQQNWIELN